LPRAFDNHYWRALYFVDPQGRVRHHHFGEGEYERSETAIQRLLAEAGVAGPRDGVVSVDADGVDAAADWDKLKSQETHVGYDRTQNFASRGGAHLDRRRPYATPARLARNQWALAGEWTMGRQATVLNGPGGRIVHRFHARDVRLVMGPAATRDLSAFPRIDCRTAARSCVRPRCGRPRQRSGGGTAVVSAD